MHTLRISDHACPGQQQCPFVSTFFSCPGAQDGAVDGGGVDWPCDSRSLHASRETTRSAESPPATCHFSPFRIAKLRPFP
jgi:hypothetical protein